MSGMNGERKITSDEVDHVKFPRWTPRESRGKTIIAMKGVPYSGKSWIAMGLGQWMRCPVVSIDDFLKALSLEKGYTIDSPPSAEEAERLYYLASYALYETAYRHLELYDFVVIKSRLCSQLELDRLMWLVKVWSDGERASLIVIDCRTTDEFRIQNDLREKSEMRSIRWRNVADDQDHKKTVSSCNDNNVADLVKDRLVSEEWYKAKSLVDIRNFKDLNFLDDQAWDLHLNGLLEFSVENRPLITRLVVDPNVDLDLFHFSGLTRYYGIFIYELPSHFLCVIKHLLDRNYWTRFKILNENEKEDDLATTDEDEVYRGDGYLSGVQFPKLRRFLVKSELDSALGTEERSQEPCTVNGGVDSCVFKHWDKLRNYEYYKETDCCGVCEERVDPDGPAYTCYFCVLTLHESCAKTLDFAFLKYMNDQSRGFYFDRIDYESEISKLKAKSACVYCKENDDEGYNHELCRACLFKTHLKARLLPTIIKHDCHEHFLSIRLKSSERSHAYGCCICNFYKPVSDLLLPTSLKHAHGGEDEHVMNLVFSRDDAVDPEKDYCCQSCQISMDPTTWFYTCQECPYYSHLVCAGYDIITQAVANRNLAIRDHTSVEEFTTDLLK